jgi:hypothetical protein
MRQLVWIVLIGIAAALVYGLMVMRRRWAERERAAEERFTAFMSKTLPQTSAGKTPPAPAAPRPLEIPAPVKTDAAASHQQLLLLEAASKAGEAGEAALSIQLYARLLARYPDSALGTQARAAIEAQKKKLAKP